MTARSNRADVRNPILALPEAQAFADLPPEAAEALRVLLIALSKKCRVTAEHSWRKHKAPVAAHWKANAVWSRHIAQALAAVRRRTTENG